MTVNQAISSCQSVYDYAVNSQFLQTILVLLFLVLPILKVVISLVKTNLKIKKTAEACTQTVPHKLLKILKRHNLSPDDFLISCEKKYIAVSIGFISKKVILSSYLITNLSIKELEAVVLHEMYHSKFFHSALLFFAEIITETFFFIPLFKDLLIILKTEFEKSADMSAVTYQKTNKYVKNSLKKMILSHSDFSIFPQFAHYIIGQRIDRLNSKKTSWQINTKRLLLSIVSIFIFTTAFIFNAKYALAKTMEESITCSLFDCVQDCVAHEILMNNSKDVPMSENNFSIDK
jgi:beta-lactamase regulating signal transducer with metallopeptidase domain